MTAASWLIGRCIVEHEQSGEERSEYGAAVIETSGISPGMAGSCHTCGRSMSGVSIQAEQIGIMGLRTEYAK